MAQGKKIWQNLKLRAHTFLWSCPLMCTQPALSALVAHSIENLCVIDEFEAHLCNWIYHDIRLSTDADPVPFEDALSHLFHLRWQLISIRDLEFPRVQIGRLVLVIMVQAHFGVVLIVLTCLQWLVIHPLHTTKIGCHDAYHEGSCPFLGRDTPTGILNTVPNRFMVCCVRGALQKRNPHTPAFAPPRERYPLLSARLTWIGLGK